MGIVLSLIALALAFAGGLGTVLLLRPPATFTRAEVCGAAVIAGSLLVSLSSFLLGLLIDGWMLRGVISLLCLGGLALAVRRDPSWFSIARPTPAAVPIAIVSVCALLLITGISLFYTDLGWDGLFNWEAKSRAAFLNHGAFPFPALGSGLTHIRYPLLVPLLGAWIYGWLGRIDQSMLKLVGPFFYLGAILLLTGSAGRFTGNRWAALLTVPLLVCVPSTVFDDGSASSGYADWPLAVIYLCTLICVIEYARTGSTAAVRLGAMTLLAGIWTKSDMLVLTVPIAAVAVPRLFRERNWKLGLLLLGPALLLRAAWSYLLSVAKAPRDADFQLQPKFSRIPAIVMSVVHECAKWKQWSLFWPLLAVALVLFLAGRYREQFLPWATGVFLPLAIYPSVFIFSAWNPITDHMASSITRLFLQIVPAAVLFVVLAVDGTFPVAPAAVAQPKR